MTDTVLSLFNTPEYQEELRRRYNESPIFDLFNLSPHQPEATFPVDFSPIEERILEATALDREQDRIDRAIAKRDRRARRRHIQALSQKWGELSRDNPSPRFLDLHIFAINHLIPPSTVVEWAENHAPDFLL